MEMAAEPKMRERATKAWASSSSSCWDCHGWMRNAMDDFLCFREQFVNRSRGVLCFLGIGMKSY
jgi:hypothetical protein